MMEDSSNNKLDVYEFVIYQGVLSKDYESENNAFLIKDFENLSLEKKKDKLENLEEIAVHTFRFDQSLFSKDFSKPSLVNLVREQMLNDLKNLGNPFTTKNATNNYLNLENLQKYVDQSTWNKTFNVFSEEYLRTPVNIVGDFLSIGLIPQMFIGSVSLSLLGVALLQSMKYLNQKRFDKRAVEMISDLKEIENVMTLSYKAIDSATIKPIIERDAYEFFNSYSGWKKEDELSPEDVRQINSSLKTIYSIK